MSHPAVSISVAALVRSWKQEGSESVWVRFRAKGQAAALQDSTRAAMVAANQDEEARSGTPRVSGSQVAATPAGPVVFVEFCASADALESWLADFAGHLGEAGLSGQLAPVKNDATPLDSARVTSLTAALSLPVDWDAVERTRERWLAATPEWYVDSATTEAVLDVVVPWVLDGPGDVFLSHGALQVAVPSEAARELVSAGLPRQPIMAVTSISSLGDFRRVAFSELGRVVLQLADPSGWRAQVDQLSGLLSGLAPAVELGLVRRSHAPVGWPRAVNNLPPRMPAGLHPGDGLQLVRHLERCHTPDAYGVQLLTDAHLANAANLSAWTVEEVAPGRYLVAAPDLTPWYAGEEPEASALDAAREDFGELVLREAHYEATPPTWPRADSLGRLPGSPWLRA